jgi:hypothetical protein
MRKIELEKCDPKQRRAATILIDIRNRVKAEIGTVYPDMTSKVAQGIKKKWQ